MNVLCARIYGIYKVLCLWYFRKSLQRYYKFLTWLYTILSNDGTILLCSNYNAFFHRNTLKVFI